MKRFPSSQAGLTLVEMLVALVVFSLLVGSIGGILFSAMRAERSTATLQNVVGEASFITEYMSRALRMAQKNTDGSACLGANENYELTGVGMGTGIRFLDKDGRCRYISWNEGAGRIQEEIDGGAASFLTSDNLSVESFGVKLLGESQEDYLQPRVTFTLTLRGQGSPEEERVEVSLQTSVSQRNIDVRK